MGRLGAQGDAYRVRSISILLRDESPLHMQGGKPHCHKSFL